MLSAAHRKRLIVILLCLSFIYLIISLDNKNLPDDMLIAEVDSLLEQRRYSEAIELLEEAVKYRGTNAAPVIKEKLEYAKKMQASAQAFEKGMQAYNGGEYLEAYRYFQRVIPEDVKHYTEARQKICELNLSMVKQLIKEKKNKDSEEER